ncbi:MAG TPA: protein-glutamate O-methyltransferase CheR, partial [Candidatus Omnitrophota bacterium]|nr:protein-glutamate O-methyltransferase CheR [Candidatus Omnitrophota bacterium]
MAVETTSIPEDLRIRFKSYINSRTGLYFKDYDLKDLDKVILARMKDRGIDSLLSYYTYITTSDGKEDELRELLNRITIKHTYFFRNEPQFNVLRKVVLPQLAEKKLKEARDMGISKPALRVWSAGCSTGEEPYTIAMVIRDSMPDIDSWDVHILATDASQDALAKAAKGIYPMNSMRLVDAEHKGRYFKEITRSGQGEAYEIDDSIKKMVTFGYHNLIDEDYPAGFDIIFCRNVVIYFELETTIKVMTKIRDSLNDNGYLFIGYSETLYFLHDKFKMVSRDDAIYYRKVGHLEAPKEEPLFTKTVEATFEEALEEISKKELEAE